MLHMSVVQWHSLRTSVCSLDHKPDCHSQRRSIFRFGKNSGIPEKMRGSIEVVVPCRASLWRGGRALERILRRWGRVGGVRREVDGVHRVSVGAARDMVWVVILCWTFMQRWK